MPLFPSFCEEVRAVKQLSGFLWKSPLVEVLCPTPCTATFDTGQISSSRWRVLGGGCENQWEGQTLKRRDECIVCSWGNNWRSIQGLENKGSRVQC